MDIQTEPSEIVDENSDIMSENNDIDNKNNKNNNNIIFNPKTEKGKFKVDCWNSEKNGDLTPRDVSKKSKKICWFTCDVCYHDFQRTIRYVVINNRWCPYCNENMVCDNDDCDICYNRSFASLGDE